MRLALRASHDDVRARVISGGRCGDNGQSPPSRRMHQWPCSSARASDPGRYGTASDLERSCNTFSMRIPFRHGGRVPSRRIGVRRAADPLEQRGSDPKHGQNWNKCVPTFTRVGCDGWLDWPADVQGLRSLREEAGLRSQPEPLHGGDEAPVQPEPPACPRPPEREGDAGIRLHALPQGQQGSKGHLSSNFSAPAVV
jgi:hypothetical protein